MIGARKTLMEIHAAGGEIADCFHGYGRHPGWIKWNIHEWRAYRPVYLSYGWDLTVGDMKRKMDARVRAKAFQLMEDCVRVFAGIRDFDVERAAWCYLTRRYESELLFDRFVRFMAESLDAYSKHYPKWAAGFFSSDIAVEGLDVLGNTLWRVSCYVPQSLMPSAPPRPYTLYASNIELPSIQRSPTLHY